MGIFQRLNEWLTHVSTRYKDVRWTLSSWRKEEGDPFRLSCILTWVDDSKCRVISKIAETEAEAVELALAMFWDPPTLP
jgi:hypothetical protein